MSYINYHRPKPADPEITHLFLTQDGVPYTYPALSSLIYRIKQKTGIKKLHMHMFRHTALTMMANEDMNAFGIQQIAGHSSIKTTEIYIHLANQQRAGKYRTYSAMDRIERSQSKSRRGRKRKEESEV